MTNIQRGREGSVSDTRFRRRAIGLVAVALVGLVSLVSLGASNEVGSTPTTRDSRAEGLTNRVGFVQSTRCTRLGSTRTVGRTRQICRQVGNRRIWVNRPTASTPGSVVPQKPVVVDPLDNEYASFTKTLPRSTVDRPDDRTDRAQIKVIYVVPSFSTDRKRDTSGEIARAAFAANEFWARQNGGFGLRFDTFQGALDVGFMTLQSSMADWYAKYFTYGESSGSSSGFRNGMSNFQTDLVKSGLWVGPSASSPNDSSVISQYRSGRLYLLVFEGPAGAYGRTGAGGGTCRSMIDAINDGVPIIGIATTGDNLRSCWNLDENGRFPQAGSVTEQNRWVSSNNAMIDHFAQWMRFLPGCGYPQTPKDGERVRIPGVVDESKAWEIRGGFMRDLAEPNDPLADAFMGGRWIAKTPRFDVRNDLYFHITSDKLASKAPCNSDISVHPLWDDLPLDRDSGRTLLRSSYDRPDDITGPQVHAVYVVRNGATDMMYDTSGDIERSLRHADEWLRRESGKGLRLDTFKGRVDVTFLPLPPGFEARTGNDCSKMPCPNDQDFYAHLRSLGRIDPNKTYLFFYSGGLSGYVLCGGAGQGKSVLLNLEVNGRFCSDAKWTESSSTALSWGLLALHELFHSLGAVCRSAPETDGDFHSSVTNDIMHGRAKGDVKLDPNRRNYWGNVPPGCTDLSTNPLFTP